MNYIQIKITTNHQDVDSIGAMLIPATEGIVIDDPQDVYEFSQEKTTKWDYIDDALLGNPNRDVTITVYLEDNKKGKENLEEIKEILAEAMITGNMKTTLEVNGVKSEDWENNWKKYYKPFNVGNNILVRPSWEKLENPDNRAVLTIDPASSFGTGSHATTKLCLEEIDTIDFKGKKVLDVGCGSGILITAMLLMGAEFGVGCDIEENAVITTAENIEKNFISKDKFSVYKGDLMSDKELYKNLGSIKYDVICANIVSDVLKNMCETLLSWIKDDGTLIISGIIEERAEEVKEYYQSKLAKVDKIKLSEGWAMIKLSK